MKNKIFIRLLLHEISFKIKKKYSIVCLKFHDLSILQPPLVNEKNFKVPKGQNQPFSNEF